MKPSRDIEQRISIWLEEEAVSHVPDRVLDATFERTRRLRQVRTFRGRSFPLFGSLTSLAAAGAAAAVLVVGGVLGLGLFVNQQGGIGAAPPSPSPDPRGDFLGTWISTSDSDDGVQTMMVERSGSIAVSIVVTDTIASVCDSTPSTMTGVGAIGGNDLVIATPDYRCDDGSEAQLINGDPTPLNEILRNLTYVRDPERDILTVGGTEVWHRPGSTPPLESRREFLGTWISTSDDDGGTQTMTVERSGSNAVSILVTDTIASVCERTPSTMTGVGAVNGNNLVIATPDYTCDDGSEPQLTNGDPTPLNEILRNLTYVRDPENDILTVGGAEVWHRPDAAGPTPAPTIEFLSEDQVAAAVPGRWEATDSEPDLSQLTMDVALLPDGSYDVIIRDDDASVCRGASSTMTGVAQLQESGSIVIAQPDYVCDDGTEAQALSGPPLDEQLHNLGFRYDPATDQVHDSLGLIWSRAAAAR